MSEQNLRGLTIHTYPRCKGKGTVVKDGPHPDEYDNKYPCPLCCPWPSRELVGAGVVVREALEGPADA